MLLQIFIALGGTKRPSCPCPDYQPAINMINMINMRVGVMWYRASNLQNLYAPRKSSAGRQTLSPRFRFTARNVALPERVPLTDCGSRPQDTRHRQRPDAEIVGAEHFGPLSLVSLFDHLVGEREQLVRHVQAQSLGGLEVDN